MPILGRTILQIYSISPGILAPISIMAISSFPLHSKIDKGTPIVLLKFPFVDIVFMLAESTWVNKSFVVVFPLDPVMPINGQVI